MLAYGNNLIQFTVKFGLLIYLTELLFAIFTFISYMQEEITGAGHSSLIILPWRLTGIILVNLGMLGLYVVKTSEGFKNRPIYIVEKMISG